MTWQDYIKEIREYEDGTRTERELSDDEKNFLRAYKAYRKFCPDGDIVIYNPSDYFGYNIDTGKRIRLEQVEVESESQL